MASTTRYQIQNRSMKPSTDAITDPSARFGKKTPRLVALLIVSRRKLTGRENACCSRLMTPACATTASTCPYRASPPSTVKTPNRMPAIAAVTRGEKNRIVPDCRYVAKLACRCNLSYISAVTVPPNDSMLATDWST
jgi:hypothetical protein